MRLPLPQFWLLLWCFVNQVPVKQTEKLLELSEKAVRHNFDLFRTHLPRDTQLLEAIVQLDEAYFGHFKGLALLIGKQKGTRKLAYTILDEHPARIDAYKFLQTYVKPETLLYTDGSTIYKGLQKHYPITHFSENHVKFEFTNTSEIEGMFGVLRTFIRRMYHHTSKEKFPEYMLEFYCRFSRPEMFTSPRHYLKNTLCLVPSG